MPKYPAPKEVQANIAWRNETLRFAQKGASAQREIKKRCRNDILYWVNTFCYTYDPRLADPVVPFITFPFQDRALGLLSVRTKVLGYSFPFPS
jgi:hypothetical protein